MLRLFEELHHFVATSHVRTCQRHLSESVSDILLV